VPVAVVIVKRKLDGERLGGTVTLQYVGVGQLVGAGCRPKWATISPLALRRFLPRTTTTVPVAPRDGLIDKSWGALPGTTDAGAVVETVAGTVVVGAAALVVVGIVDAGSVDDGLVGAGSGGAVALGRPRGRAELECAPDTSVNVTIPSRATITTATSTPSSRWRGARRRTL
jgi:hypothetical protein